MTRFNNIGLIVKTGDDSVATTLHEVYQLLRDLGVNLLAESSTAGMLGDIPTVDMESVGRDCDLAIVIGGDGTLLHAARSLASFDVPLVGVNRGRLGFLVDVSPEGKLYKLNEIVGGDYIEEHRMLLDCQLIRDGQCIHRSLAFNDMVARTKNVLQILEFEISIDDSFVLTQRADGIIVASPSGSTAYSLSSGGPIVNPNLDAIVLQPVCPHTLSSRPLVVTAESLVKVQITDRKPVKAQMVCDGQVYTNLMVGDVMQVRKHDQTTRLLHPTDYDYHHILREKLNWG